MAKRTAAAASEAKPAGVVISIEGDFDPLDIVSGDEPVSKTDEGDDDPGEGAADDAGDEGADGAADDGGGAADDGGGADDAGADDDGAPTEPVTKIAAQKLTSDALARLMEAVNAISKADAIEAVHATELRDIAKALDSEAVAGNVTPEDARKVTTDALSKLMTTTNLVKALDDEIDALPAAITQSLGEIAASLNGAAATTVKADDDAPTNPEPEQPNLIVYKSAREDGDLDLVIKRGAKMKTTRLSKLKEANAMLTKLIDELDSEAASDGGKKSTKKSEGDGAAAPTVDTAAIVAEVTSAVKKTIAGAVTTINDSLNTLKGEIDAVTKRVDDVDGVVPDGNADDGDADVKPVDKSDQPASFSNILGING